MKNIERRVAQEATMQVRERIIEKAERGRMTWQQAAQVLGITARQLRRVRKRYTAKGKKGLEDGRRGRPRKKQIAKGTAERMCELKSGKYEEFSIKHFYEIACEKHGLKASYEWLRLVLLEAGVVEKTPKRGKYRRRRPRQPMVGMRLHTDGSTHPWLGPDRPKWDLVIMLDDADGRLLAARFVPEESVMSTLQLLEDVLTRWGRFGELYHDRGSMYCRTSNAQVGPDAEQSGQIPRVLKTLGIGQIWAYSPQARGRCERAFGTIQGRLCAELKLAGITDYVQANDYLQDVFIDDFNRRFTVEPAEPESAFVPLVLNKLELKLLLSEQSTRRINNDYTLRFDRRILQLQEPKDKTPLQKRKATVHRFTDGTLGVSYRGKLLAYFEDEEPSLKLPADRKYQPLPTLPEPVHRGGLDFNDPNFWAFLNDGHNDTSPVLIRSDLHVPGW